MTVKLGVAPIAWSNDDLPQLGGDTTLETCLAEAREGGFLGIEKGGKFPMDPAELGPILEAHDLDLVSGWFSGAILEHGDIEREKDLIREQLELYQALGCPVMVYAECTGSVQTMQTTPVSARPRLDDEQIRDYGKKLTPFAEWLAEQNCPMSYHHHMGTVIESDTDVHRLMNWTGEAVGLLYDTGHLHFAGADHLAVARQHAARINHVHVKDVRQPVLDRLRAEDQSFLWGVLEGVYTVPGDGCIDYAAVAAFLKEIDYAGWVVIEAEQDPAKADPFTYSKNGREHIAELFDKVGIEMATSRG